MPAIALLVKESLSWLIKVVTTPRNIEKPTQMKYLIARIDVRTLRISDYIFYILVYFSSLTSGK